MFNLSNRLMKRPAVFLILSLVGVLLLYGQGGSYAVPPSGGTATAPSGTGLAFATGSAFTLVRSIAAGFGMTVANGDGAAGNPTPAVDTAVMLSRANAQAGTTLFFTETSASATVYSGTMSPTLTAYTAGMLVNWPVVMSCTGGVATTINIDTLGAKSVKLADGSTDPTSADCAAGRNLTLAYNGTLFKIVAGGTTGSTPFIYNLGNSGAKTMTGSPVDIYTISNATLAAGHCLRIETEIVDTAGGADIELYVDATKVLDSLITQLSNFTYIIPLRYCNDSGTQATQYAHLSSSQLYGAGTTSGTSVNNPYMSAGGSAFNGVYTLSNNIDWSSSHTIHITGLASSATVTGLQVHVVTE